MKLKPFEKFLKHIHFDKELISVYKELRELFQKYEWSEKDLEKPPYYTNDMMLLHYKFQQEKNSLFSELKSYFDITTKEFDEYIGNKLKEINDLTPLKDGSKERDDRGDEDY